MINIDENCVATTTMNDANGILNNNNNNNSNNNNNNNNEGGVENDCCIDYNYNTDGDNQVVENIKYRFNHHKLIANDNIIPEGKDRFYAIKQFHSDIFSEFYPKELTYCISKEEYIENVVKKANDYNKFKFAKKYKFIHGLNIFLTLALHGVNLFLLFYYKASEAYFAIILLPTFLFVLSTYGINILQQNSMKRNSHAIENYFEKLSVEYKNLTFITLFNEDHNRKFFFGQLSIILKEIIIEYPIIDRDLLPVADNENVISNSNNNSKLKSNDNNRQINNSNENQDDNIVIDIDSITPKLNGKSNDTVIMDKNFLEI